MKTKYYISMILIILSLSINAQNEVQAYRFSQVYPFGTARFQSMGGAFGAVGGDFTSASQNPAGIGVYRNAEFTFSPNFLINNATSNYLGETGKDQATNFSIGNIGFVKPYQFGYEEGLVSFTYALGYNALNNYKSSTIMQGVNNQSSLLDNFAWYANEYNSLDPFYEDLAHQTGLMPLDTVINEYWHYLQPYDAIGYDGYGQDQVRIVEKQGYTGEYVFSAAMNFSNKLYIGGTFGLHSVRFSEDVYHEETDSRDLEPDFQSFSFGEYNSTRGYGYVFKFGVIFKPIHALRLGAAFHGPTVYQLTDDKFTEIKTYWDSNSGLSDSQLSVDQVYSKDYTLRTPYRASASAAVLIGDLGLVSAEYEYLDYSSSDLESTRYKFEDENITISRDFKAVHNVKAGFELRLNPLYVRGGFQYFMNAYTDTRNGSDRYVFSGGLGFRSNQTFLDLSYAYSSSRELYGLYSYAPEFEEGFERSINNYKLSNIRVTLGYNF